METETIPCAKAYLYDCDGTLVDSMPTHIQAWVKILQENGCPLSAEKISAHITELAGMPGEKVVEVMNERYSLNLNPDEIAEKKETYFFETLIHEVKPILRVVEHLRKHSPHTPVAVVSGGRKIVVEKTLEVAGIRNFFQVIICAEDVKQGKPHPEGFLMAAKKLAVHPHDCLVFEDGELGIQAAKTAGMQFFKVVNG